MRKKLFYSSRDNSVNFIYSDARALTIYHIANTLFMLEKSIKEGSSKKIVSIDFFMDFTDSEIKKLSEILNNLVLDVLCEDVKFIFCKKKFKKKKKVFEFKNCEAICLFSGGVDSTLGMIESKKEFPQVLGLYISHGDLGKITKKVLEIRDQVLKPSGLEMVKVMAPKMGQGYSQVRGFLYLLYAGIVSIFTRSNKIIISECGTTMYQPKFAPLDTITYTTHPLVLKSSKEIIEIILGRKIEVITPFEDFTKTEMVRLITNDNILSKTHSCITGRWGINCGRCYACISRMIASINLNLKLDYFRSNAFLVKDDNVLNSFVNFCFNFELNRSEIDYWSLYTITKNRKEDLFLRSGRDVFLALKKLKDEGGLDINYEFILDFYTRNKKEVLNKREKELSSPKKPDFNKLV